MMPWGYPKNGWFFYGKIMEQWMVYKGKPFFIRENPIFTWI
jgi:hypothetical protein